MKYSSPLVVEFVGLPGAGKTTVFREVVTQLRREGITVIPRDEMLQQWQNLSLLQRLLRLIPQTRNQWSVLWHSVSFAAQVKPINLASFHKVAQLFANVSRLDAIAPSQGCGVILLDQGFLQEVWSVGITGSFPSSLQIQSELSCLLRLRRMAIVEFNIDVETALGRIQGRPTQESRFDRMQPQEARSRLLQYEAGLQAVIQGTKVFAPRFMEVDSTHSIEEKANKIVRWIHSLVTQEMPLISNVN